MKKSLIIAAASAFLLSGLAATEATAGMPKALKKCKSCHKVDKDATGPGFKSVKAAYTAAYGADAEAKLAAFLGDVAMNGKKATTDPTVAKFAKKVKTMRGQGKKVKKVGADKAAAAIMAL
ncbi:MAG: hypothetical protein R8M46_06230 [Ghiorsea sp.]